MYQAKSPDGSSPDGSSPDGSSPDGPSLAKRRPDSIMRGPPHPRPGPHDHMPQGGGAVGVSPPEVGVSPSKVGVRPGSESDPGRSRTDRRKNELGRSLIFEGRRVGKSESDSGFSEQLSGSIAVFS